VHLSPISVVTYFNIGAFVPNQCSNLL